MREWRSTILFLILLSGMGCVWLAIQIRQEKVMDQSEMRLISHGKNIDSLTFISPSNTIQCRLRETIWEVCENQENWYQANPALIYQFIERLSHVELHVVAQVDVSIENQEIWTDYGITAEAMRIDFQDGEQNRSLVLGANVELEDKIYLLDETFQRLYTVDKKVFVDIPMRADDWLSRSLFLNTDVQIDQIEISSLLGYIELIYDNGEGWLLSQPRKGFLHQQTVHQFIDRLRSGLIEDILTEETTDFSLYGLDDDALRITLSGLSKGSFTLAIGQPVPGNSQMRYARRGREQRVVLIDQSLYEDVIDAFKKFRATQVFDMQDDQPVSLTWQGMEQTISLELDDKNRWNMTRPYSWVAAEESVSEVIEFLRGMAITRFNSETYNRYEQTDWRIDYLSGDHDQVSLMTAADADAPMQIRFSDEKVQHEINRVKTRDDFFNPLYFKNRKLFSYDAGEIAFIERYIDQHEDKLIWDDSTENQPNPPLMTREEQDALREYIITLNAQKYIAIFPPSLEIYALDTPRMRIKIGLNSAGRFGNELRIGAQTDQGYFAMIRGRNLIFLLSQDQIDRLFVNMPTN